ncbi:MAG: response regulator transcription factor [Deltaproteobacteria bacterium]|nr:response regulator transcription factor [Deltaproteobacteria bacterium]
MTGGHRAEDYGDSGAGEPMRVVIADDHALFRQGLRMMLELQSDVRIVGEAATMDELTAIVAGAVPDLLLLDLQMERSALPDVPVLAERTRVVVVTANEAPEEALAVLRLGVRGVVFKRYAIETLMGAIRSVQAGHVWMPPELQAAMTAEWRTPGVQGLTERELEVVRHVARGLRNAEVATRLHVSEVTVKTHLTNVFQKLGVRDRVELALWAVRTGLVDVRDRLG